MKSFLRKLVYSNPLLTTAATLIVIVGLGFQNCANDTSVLILASSAPAKGYDAPRYRSIIRLKNQNGKPKLNFKWSIGVI